MAAKPAQFAAAVLRGIGAPVTSQNIAGFIGWSKAEGPLGSSSWQRNNPLNTTESQGAVGGAFNSAGVRGYPTPQAGVRATVKTLTNGDYGGIVRAFKQNNPHALGPAIGASPWGTSGSLAAQTIADTLSQHFNAPSGASSLGAPSQPSRRGATTVRLPGRTVTTQKQVFDSGAFNAAKAANLVGNYLSSVKNPAAGLAPKIPGLTSAASSNPLFTAGVVTTGASPNPSDYMKAQTVLQHIAGQKVRVVAHPGAVMPGASGNDINPLAHGWQLTETDMGVDAVAKPGTPILAMNDSKLVHVAPFYQGQPIAVFQILDGPNKGKYWYVSEQINSLPKTGTVIRRGQPVARFAPTGTGIEIGWASGHGTQTLAQAQDTAAVLANRHAVATPQGVNFSRTVLHHAPVSAG